MTISFFMVGANRHRGTPEVSTRFHQRVLELSPQPFTRRGLLEKQKTLGSSAISSENKKRSAAIFRRRLM